MCASFSMIMFVYFSHVFFPFTCYHYPCVQDHIVLLPEDYYKSTVLRKDVANKCQVGRPLDEYCLQYEHSSMNSDGFVTIETEKSLFTGAEIDFVQPPFQGVTLHGYQVRKCISVIQYWLMKHSVKYLADF